MEKIGLSKRTLYSLTTLLLIFMTAELGFRLYDIGTGRIFFSDLITHFYKLTNVSSHPYLTYTSNRGYDGVTPMMEPGIKYSVKINSDGFRTREFFPKTPNVIRIAILGDSYAYGYGANQDETLAAVLEKKLRNAFSQNIEVYSFGIASYSGIKYAMIARSYFEFVKPDIVIASVDQSDFEGDLLNWNDYILDADGAPLIPKNYREISAKIDARFIRNDRYEILARGSGKDWQIRLRAGSSLFNFLYRVWRRLNIEIGNIRKDLADTSNQRSKNPEAPVGGSENKTAIVKYENLVKEHGTDLRNTIADIGLNNIPVSIKMAEQLYNPTFKSLKFVKKKSDEIGAKFYLSSYPLPWFVSTEEAKSFQLKHFGNILDFRSNRVYLQLMNNYAARLGTKNLDSHFVFENSKDQNYGDYDPHFNANGYALYADFLFNSIKDDVAIALKQIDKSE